MSLLRTAIRGAAAGLVGTSAMSVVMLAARKAGLLGKAPPKRITEATLERLRIGGSEETRNALSTMAHLAYGMGGGVLLSFILRDQRRRAAPVAGALFGTTVWAASYAGWIPAFGIMPPPHRDRPGRPLAMIAAHLVYGVVTGAGAATSRSAATTSGERPPAQRIPGSSAR